MYREYIFYFPIANVVVCERSKDETKQLLGCEDGSLVRLLLCITNQIRDALLQFFDLL